MDATSVFQNRSAHPSLTLGDSVNKQGSSHVNCLEWFHFYRRFCAKWYLVVIWVGFLWFCLRNAGHSHIWVVGDTFMYTQTRLLSARRFPWTLLICCNISLDLFISQQFYCMWLSQVCFGSLFILPINEAKTFINW